MINNSKFFGIKERDKKMVSKENYHEQKKKTNIALQNQKKKQILISTEQRFGSDIYYK